MSLLQLQRYNKFLRFCDRKHEFTQKLFYFMKHPD